MFAQKGNHSKSGNLMGKENVPQFSNRSKISMNKTDLNKSLKKSIPETPILTQKQIENQFISSNYREQIKKTIFSLPKKHSNCLNRHNISSLMRAKMVDWMIEVLSSYKYSNQCFFLATRLMDQYLQKTEQKQTGDLHIIGVVCMFIACKYQQIYPLKMKVIYQKIGHKKLAKQQILKVEQSILDKLDFCLVYVSHYDLVIFAIRQLRLQQLLSKLAFSYLQKVALYLAKMITFQLQIYQKYQMNELAAAVIYVSFKIIQQVQKHFKPEKYVKMFQQIGIIAKFLNMDEQLVVQSACKVLWLAKCFQKKYSGVQNLKKFNGFSLQSKQKKI